MGINAQQIVILKSDIKSVQIELANCLQSRGFHLTESEPIKQITAPREFENRKRRFFFLLEYPSLISLSESGELADQQLAQDLSRQLSASIYWIALHESENAWGKVLYSAGDKKSEELNPASAFEKGKEKEKYELDATEGAFEECKKIGDFEPFVTYYHLANGYEVEGRLAQLHLAFKKS